MSFRITENVVEVIENGNATSVGMLGSGVDVVNNLTTTEIGHVLDARQGKQLNDKITTVSGNVTKLGQDLTQLKTAQFGGLYFFKVGRLVFFYGRTGSMETGTQKTICTVSAEYAPVTNYAIFPIYSSGSGYAPLPNASLWCGGVDGNFNVYKADSITMDCYVSGSYISKQ